MMNRGGNGRAREAWGGSRRMVMSKQTLQWAREALYKHTSPGLSQKKKRAQKKEVQAPHLTPPFAPSMLLSLQYNTGTCTPYGVRIQLLHYLFPLGT
jgi:hypothetical protein